MDVSVPDRDRMVSSKGRNGGATSRLTLPDVGACRLDIVNRKTKSALWNATMQKRSKSIDALESKVMDERAKRINCNSQTVYKVLLTFGHCCHR
jgi:hypothetical protein